jgi:hypothetical protein
VGLSRGYYITAARNAGVPEMWVEDAAQDMALQFWRRGGGDNKAAVRYAAIDMARRYGLSRHGNDRVYAELDDARYHEAPDLYGVVERMLDVRQAWQRLTSVQRRIIRNSVAGKPDVSHQRVYQAREHLRRWAA